MGREQGLTGRTRPALMRRHSIILQAGYFALPLTLVWSSAFMRQSNADGGRLKAELRTASIKRRARPPEGGTPNGVNQAAIGWAFCFCKRFSRTSQSMLDKKASI